MSVLKPTFFTMIHNKSKNISWMNKPQNEYEIKEYDPTFISFACYINVFPTIYNSNLTNNST